MVSTDPISDMFTRIRNASMVNQSQVSMPHSKIKEDVAKILVSSGFLTSVNVDDKEEHKKLIIDITSGDKPSVISEIKRVSRPGRRVYIQAKEIPTVKRGRGIVIMSTSQGILTGGEAATKKLGGELICEVY